MFKLIKEDIAGIMSRDPAATNKWQIISLYPGLHAIWGHRLAYFLYQKKWHWLAKFIALCNRWLTGIEIHPQAQIGRRCFIDHGMGVVIGQTAEIGEECTLYHGVTLGGTTLHQGKRHPTLQANVIVGAGAKILGPITIGEGARIGSNAVVVQDVPAGATVIGIPGREVISKSVAEKERRHALAQKIGFDAYGVVDNLPHPDPVAHAIQAMLDHMHAMDKQISVLSKTIETISCDFKALDIPELTLYDFEQPNAKSSSSDNESQ
jgi:serine O-acetyltransferase